VGSLLTEERDLVDYIFLNRHMIYGALSDKMWELRSSAYQYRTASPHLSKAYMQESDKWATLHKKLQELINGLRNDG